MSMKHILSPSLPQDLLTNVKEGDSQPNAVDLRIQDVFNLRTAEFRSEGDKKVHRGSDKINVDEHGNWTLLPGIYEIVMENIVKIPEGYAGWVITRSTLNRNGLFITSGLYDSGYHGVMAGLLHVKGGSAVLQRGSRVGQFLLFESETLSKYDGSYGIGKEHDEKYGN